MPDPAVRAPKPHNYEAERHEWRVTLRLTDQSSPCIGRKLLLKMALPICLPRRAGRLVGSKMDAAVNASVRDVVCNLVERVVLQDDLGQRLSAEVQRVALISVNPVMRCR
jgi:hypothetical protein